MSTPLSEEEQTAARAYAGRLVEQLEREATTLRAVNAELARAGLKVTAELRALRLAFAAMKAAHHCKGACLERARLPPVLTLEDGL